MQRPHDKRNRKVERRGGAFDGAISGRAIPSQPGYTRPLDDELNIEELRRLRAENRERMLRRQWEALEKARVLHGAKASAANRKHDIEANEQSSVRAEVEDSN